MRRRLPASVYRSGSPGDHPGKPADIWSLGAMMFKVLTGEYPFGVYLDAAVNVKNQTRKHWPPFMTSNAQYAPLAKSLQDIVDSCLRYDAESRPTADQLVTEFSKLCYINVHRTEGDLTNLIQNGYSGFTNDADGGVFFSMESVYGSRRPSQNRRVCYSRFPGSPRYRGHPIVVID
jgi:serine/threonine protein kinase, bacterial